MCCVHMMYHKGVDPFIWKCLMYWLHRWESIPIYVQHNTLILHIYCLHIITCVICTFHSFQAGCENFNLTLANSLLLSSFSFSFLLLFHHCTSLWPAVKQKPWTMRVFEWIDVYQHANGIEWCIQREPCLVNYIVYSNGTCSAHTQNLREHNELNNNDDFVAGTNGFAMIGYVMLCYNNWIDSFEYFHFFRIFSWFLFGIIM